MNVHTAHCLLPLSAPRDVDAREGLLYIDHAGLAGADSWRRRVRARIGAMAFGLLGRPRF